MAPPAALPPGASIFSEKHKSLQLAVYNSSNRQHPATLSWATVGTRPSATRPSTALLPHHSNGALEREETGVDRSWLRLGNG